jgi:hypothetical protein
MLTTLLERDCKTKQPSTGKIGSYLGSRFWCSQAFAGTGGILDEVLFF